MIKKDKQFLKDSMNMLKIMLKILSMKLKIVLPNTQENGMVKIGHAANITTNTLSVDKQLLLVFIKMKTVLEYIIQENLKMRNTS